MPTETPKKKLAIQVRLTNTIKGHNKFYTMESYTTEDKAPPSIDVIYGKIGSSGKRLEQKMIGNCLDHGITQIRAMAATKMAKGYKVESAYTTVTEIAQNSLTVVGKRLVYKKALPPAGTVLSAIKKPTISKKTTETKSLLALKMSPINEVKVPKMKVTKTRSTGDLSLDRFSDLE
jgi:predicted DNA-binding WGR domain protein